MMKSVIDFSSPLQLSFCLTSFQNGLLSWVWWLYAPNYQSSVNHFTMSASEFQFETSVFLVFSLIPPFFRISGRKLRNNDWYHNWSCAGFTYRDGPSTAWYFWSWAKKCQPGFFIGWFQRSMTMDLEPIEGMKLLTDKPTTKSINRIAEVTSERTCLSPFTKDNRECGFMNVN